MDSLKRIRPEAAEVDQYILKVVRKQRPKDVRQLVKAVQKKFSMSEEKILENILRLQSEGKLTLTESWETVSQRFSRYIFSKQAYWYWTTVLIAAITTTLVFTISEDSYPIAYARYLFGAIFVLWVPGYSFIKALFPTREVDNIERVALSIGISVALVSIAGIFLSCTPFGVRLTSVMISLLTLAITFATLAVVREHQTKLKAKG